MIAKGNLLRRVQQFDAKHGPESVTAWGWMLFPDGASRQIDQPGELREPPTDPTALYEAKMRYSSARSEQSQLEDRIMQFGTPAQRVELFHKRNGADCVQIGEGWFVYSNGAKREVNIYGALVDPPDNLYQRCKLQIKYREELLRRATRKFEELKAELQHRVNEAERWAHAASPPSPPSDNEFADLKQHKAIVKACQQALDEARQSLVDNRPEDMKRREQLAAERLPAIQAAKHLLDEINI